MPGAIKEKKKKKKKEGNCVCNRFNFSSLFRQCSESMRIKNS